MNIEAWRDNRGVMGKPLEDTPTIPPGLQEIKGEARVTFEEGVEVGEDEMEVFGRIVEERCPVAYMMIRGGCRVELEWKVERQEPGVPEGTPPGPEGREEGKDSKDSNFGTLKYPSSTNLYTTPLIHPPLPSITPPTHVTIYGAGLAGISVLYHIRSLSPSTTVTIIDKVGVGMGGASNVAGGLFHPFTPRGKLIWGGEEGMRKGEEMIFKAEKSGREVVVGRRVFRAAVKEGNEDVCKGMLERYEEIMEGGWMGRDEFEKTTGCKGIGGVEYGGGSR
jgi:hypothetical protein